MRLPLPVGLRVDRRWRRSEGGGGKDHGDIDDDAAAVGCGMTTWRGVWGRKAETIVRLIFCLPYLRRTILAIYGSHTLLLAITISFAWMGWGICFIFDWEYACKVQYRYIPYFLVSPTLL